MTPPRVPTIIELTIQEWRSCVYEGDQRLRAWEKNLTGKRVHWGGADPRMVEVVGACGEAAVKKWLGQPVRFDPHRFGDGGKGDVVLPSGRTIFVRTHGTRWREMFLGLRAWKTILEDDYAIMCCTDPREIAATILHNKRFVIFGYVTRQQFVERAEWRDWGYGRQLGVMEWNLEPLDTFHEVERNAGQMNLFKEA